MRFCTRVAANDERLKVTENTRKHLELAAARINFDSRMLNNPLHQVFWENISVVARVASYAKI